MNNKSRDRRQHKLPVSACLFKGTPVVTAGCMLGFLPQRVEGLIVSLHNSTHSYKLECMH